MIDTELTLYKSVVSAINKLRYQAKDDKKAFKSLVFGLLLHDMLEWAKTEPQYIQEHLSKLESKWLRCNPVFQVEYTDDSSAYVNVNTPQTVHTWKQIWDNPNTRTVIGIQCEDGDCSKSIRKYTQVKKIIINNDIV